jgi:hypothetical protein
LAGTAEAPETANSPTAADVAAAKAIILSVIELSCSRSWSKPGGGSETTEPAYDVRRRRSSAGGVNVALAHDRIADILTEIVGKFGELRS